MNKLKKALKERDCIQILEAHNGLSGKIVENSGFEGMWESSLTDSGSKGLPDTELVTMDSRLATIRQIREVTTKPMIVDGDTGGQLDHFPYWVKRLEYIGVEAVIIEDKCYPKKNSLDKSASHILEDPDKFAAKIAAGKKVSKDIMIFARLESLIAKHSMYEALIRAEAYIKAGADGIMIHSKSEVSGDEVLEFAARFREKWDLPLVCVPTTYNHMTEKELREAGFNVIIHANHLLRASYKAMQMAADQIESDGRSVALNNDIATVKDIFAITGYTK
jgi:phosphoenolpyruvate phosphomutase / 2-hydroxyethylphosphonate cytidylyltransferase